MARSYRTGGGAGGDAGDITGRFRLPTKERHWPRGGDMPVGTGSRQSPSPRPTGPSSHMGPAPLASFVSASIGHGPAQLMGRGMPPPDCRRRGAATTQGAVASCLPPGTSRVTTGSQSHSLLDGPSPAAATSSMPQITLYNILKHQGKQHYTGYRMLIQDADKDTNTKCK